MERKMIVNDIRANKLLAVSICFFMTASAFLAALAGMLSAGLLGSVEVLMEKAKTPDFLQMHTGTIEEEEVFRFAGENEAVESCQILKFLNLSNASLTLGGHSMKDSTQDNGVCTQSAAFDFLLDMENEVITVREGEIYVPVCYRQEYGLEAGQTVQIGAQTFVIAGFLRDSQMSSMMASSKRFLVCGKDYERLRAQGTEEYLIEFLLRGETDVNIFAKVYADAKLPANGPAITRPLIRMMNALSEGLLILVVLLVCLLMLFISLLCIRFTLLTKLQENSMVQNEAPVGSGVPVVEVSQEETPVEKEPVAYDIMGVQDTNPGVDAGKDAAASSREHGQKEKDAEGGEQPGGNLFLQDLRTEEFRPEVQQSAEAANLAEADSTENIMRQIMDYMKVQLKEDTSSLEMQLHPASLGTVQVQIASRGGAVTANFITQNEAVKTALESQMPQLIERFGEQGVKVEAIEVTVQSHAFERNLEQGGNRDRQNEEPARKGRVRRINLNDTVSMESMEEEDALAADMMAVSGNTVDYTA